MLRGVVAMTLVALSHGQSSIWTLYPHYDAMWTEFKKVFHKSYAEGEDADRSAVFRNSVQEVVSVNSKYLTYTFGLTKFSDYLQSEMLALSGGVKESTDNLWASKTYLGQHKWRGEELPDSVDWVSKGAVTPAKDQKICGSCWAFSAVASLEGSNYISTGNLVSLSEQQAMQCGSPTARGCEGGWPDNVFKYAPDNDLCTEESYPYQGVDTIPCFWNDPTHSSCVVAVKKGAVAGYKDVEV